MKACFLLVRVLLALGAATGGACAHAPTPAPQANAGHEAGRHAARLSHLEALVTTLQARLEVLQAQSRAQGELARPGSALTYEQWQPRALERVLAGGSAAAIEGRGESVQRVLRLPERK